MRPGNASELLTYQATNGLIKSGWKKEKANHFEKPMSIYEVHPGSWRKDYADEKDEDGFYNYKRFADELVEYVRIWDILTLSLWVLQSIHLMVLGDIR